MYTYGKFYTPMTKNWAPAIFNESNKNAWIFPKYNIFTVLVSVVDSDAFLARS